MAVTAASSGRLRHLALFYHGRCEYLAALGGFIRASRARGDAVFVAVPERKAELVRRELDDDSAQVTLVNMAELGRNPARIIPAVLTYAGRYQGRLLGGNGLWLVNQVCDLVQARTGQAGTTTRLHMRLHRA